MNMSSSRSGSKFERAIEFLRQDQVKKTNWIGSSKLKKMSRSATKHNLSLMMMMLNSTLIMKTKKDEVENLQSQY